MPTENHPASDEIPLVHQVSRDIDRSHTARCPHCNQVIDLEGDDLDEIRSEQYQHKRCGGWLEVCYAAAFVHELPEAAP